MISIPSFKAFGIKWAEENGGLKTRSRCLDAMERGVLSVHAENRYGACLWHYGISVNGMSVHSWTRLAALNPELNVFWSKHRNSLTLRFCKITPSDMKDILDLEYFWQDLELVTNFVKDQNSSHDNLCMLSHELQKRLEWPTCLRRAWIAAIVIL